MPGDNIKMVVTDPPVAMDGGLRFAIRERTYR